MKSPKITVLMPLFNGENYLKQAISSILTQTFTDFEFLIIDDGSTDRSVEIIDSFHDLRIKLVKNSQNVGIIETLNRGIKSARGQYIARMDADDISHPERLSKQVYLLDSRQDVDVVSSTIKLIDSTGKEKGHWKADIECVDFEDIIQRIPDENCIAHPSIMVRTATIIKFGYSTFCQNAEDYDLWLRMISAGLKFVKIRIPLLSYRIHEKSITAASNEKRYKTKNIRVKANFLAHLILQRKIPNSFDIKVIKGFIKESWAIIYCIITDYSKGGIGLASRYFGRAWGKCFSKKKTREMFFFLPAYHIGGSEKVHLDIVQVFRERQPVIIMTCPSKDETFKERFSLCGNLIDISSHLKYFFGVEFMIGFWTSAIAKVDNPVVLGSNSGFYYYLLRYIGHHAYTADVLHAFGAGFEFLSLGVVDRLDRRIVISEQTIVDLKELYRSKGLNVKFEDRIRKIENYVDIPAQVNAKGRDKNLHILYVGRGGPEKRVHLIGKIATHCARKRISVDFTLIGNVDDCLTEEQKKICRCVGALSDPIAVAEHYKVADVLLITSTREGFPLVVMECMAHGVVPLCTNVGGIHFHVKGGKTGFLVRDSEDETDLVNRFVELIEKLCSDRPLTQRMSVAVHKHAKRHFSKKNFIKEYEKELQRFSNNDINFS